MSAALTRRSIGGGIGVGGGGCGLDLSAASLDWPTKGVSADSQADNTIRLAPSIAAFLKVGRYARMIFPVSSVRCP